MHVNDLVEFIGTSYLILSIPQENVGYWDNTLFFLTILLYRCHPNVNAGKKRDAYWRVIHYN